MVRLLVAAWLTVVVAACGGPGSEGASDCDVALRVDNTVFVSAGIIEATATPAGQAESSSCDDNGEDAKGMYFSDDAPVVDVWTFEKQDPGVVLGVRLSGGSFSVYIAEDQDRSKVFRALKHDLASARS